jgi:hypothetical protein
MALQSDSTGLGLGTGEDRVRRAGALRGSGFFVSAPVLLRALLWPFSGLLPSSKGCPENGCLIPPPMRGELITISTSLIAPVLTHNHPES